MSDRQRIGALLLVVILLFAGRLLWNRLFVEEPTIATAPQLYTVYFSSGNKTYLMPEYRFGEGTISQRLDALVSGPQHPNLAPLLPQGTRVISYEESADLLYVNFSEDLLLHHSGGSIGELITIYGIVNTLTEIESVKRVQILVAGKMVSTIAGHVDISNPLVRDWSLIGSQKL